MSPTLAATHPQFTQEQAVPVGDNGGEAAADDSNPAMDEDGPSIGSHAAGAQSVAQ